MVKTSEIDLPVIFKNHLLFKSGKWNPKTNNNFEFTDEMVNKSVKNTNWTSLNKRLYLKHEGAFDISKWKGNVENIRAEEGKVYGDVHLWDAEEGIGILYGKKPAAISADISYNDSGVMFFKGFALENDPGVKDEKMFLSEAVRDELSGLYSASFSSELTTNEMNGVQTNAINTQSAERRLLSETVNMESQTNTPNANPTTTPKETVDRVSTPVINVNTNVSDVELVRKLSEKIEALEANNKVITDKLAVVEQTKAPEVKTEGTVANAALKTVMPENINNVDDLVNKIAEKIKPVITPQPITMNELSGNAMVGDNKTIDRLAAHFEQR